MGLFRFPLPVWFEILVFAWITGTASAATYNFYFNNTEQGANSTASPKVQVNPSVQKESDGVAPAVAPLVNLAPADQSDRNDPRSSETPQSQSSHVEANPQRPFWKTSSFRLGLGLGYGERAFGARKFADQERSAKFRGYQLLAALNLSRDFSLSGFYFKTFDDSTPPRSSFDPESFYGAEFEYLPFGLDFLGRDRRAVFGLAAGIMGSDLAKKFESKGLPFSPFFWGPRAELRLDDQWLVSLNTRLSAQTRIISLGLGIRI
jgi:hypothetical protein